MTVKEAIEYIISESKKDESLLTDTNRFKAYLSDLAPEYKEKGLNVVKKNLDSDFLEICFDDKEDVRRRVSRIKYRLEKDGLAEHWIDFIIDSFFTPLGWMPPKDEEETSHAQNQQTQYQQTQNQQIQSQQTQNQQTQYQQTQNQQTQKQQIQNQQTQKQQIQKQQTQKQQTQNQQTQKQQTQKQQTQKQQTQKQQTQKQQTQKQQTQKQQTQNQQTQKQQTQNQQIQNQQIQKQQTQNQQTQNQQIQNRQTQNGGKWGFIFVLILTVLFILCVILSNSNVFSYLDKSDKTDHIIIGSYPQTADGQVQPIKWLILAREGNKILLLSKCGLETMHFDSSSGYWENSEIRKWLNNDFYNKAFSEDDKKYIKSSNLSDVGTTDNVFLLSKNEAEKYFYNDDARTRRCKATEYAVKNGAYVDRLNGYSFWWLRSLGVYAVNEFGNLDERFYKDTTYVVRPALWINSDIIETDSIKLANLNIPERFNSSSFKNVNVGDYINLGWYSQTSSDGVKPIEWQVLSKEKNKILVISRYSLEKMRFGSSNNWKNSYIRHWLNNDFYNNAFSEDEKKSINSFGDDKIFLLSKEEAEKYSVDERCKATEYALSEHVWRDDNGNICWWLRSPDHFDNNCVYYVNNVGFIRSTSVDNDILLVRPALWINL